jgi:hypothetical protein
MVLRLRHLGKQIRNTCEVFECGAGEERRRSVGQTCKNEEDLHRVKEEGNILHSIKRRKANWLGHIVRWNCLLKHVIHGKIEGEIEVTGR